MALVYIRLGYKTAAWFTANPTFVLRQGEIVFKEQSGLFKLGDGTTDLQSLAWLGVANVGGGIWGNITGTLTNQTDLVSYVVPKTLPSDTNITGSYTLNVGTALNPLVNFYTNVTGTAALNSDDGLGNTSSVYAYAFGSGLTGSILGSTSSFDLSGINMVVNSNFPVFAGIQEGLDFSANYTNASLVRKSYADGLVTDANITGKLITGYVSGAGTVAATDTILQAIQKLNGNVGLLTGAIIYQGTWNASTNTPTLTSGVGTKGYLYKVGTAGTTTIDGINQWNAGDQIVFNGTVWDKIDGIPNEVVSVNGAVGAVTVQATLVSGTNIKTVNGTSLLGAGDIGAINETHGGTNQTTYTTGDILFASASNTLSKLAASTSGYVLTSNGAGTAPSWQVTPDKLTYYAGFYNWNPADSTDYYFGQFTVVNPSTSPTTRKMKFLKSGTLTDFCIVFHTTAGSTSETVPIYLRDLTTSTDYLIMNVTLDGATGTFNNFTTTGLTIAINSSHDYTIKISCPAFATNPTGVGAGATLYVK